MSAKIVNGYIFCLSILLLLCYFSKGTHTFCVASYRPIVKEARSLIWFEINQDKTQGLFSKARIRLPLTSMLVNVIRSWYASTCISYVLLRKCNNPILWGGGVSLEFDDIERLLFHIVEPNKNVLLETHLFVMWNFST